MARLRAKTLLYFKGHFVAEGEEFEAPAERVPQLIASNVAEEVEGGKGSGQVKNLTEAPDPTANLVPVSRRGKGQNKKAD